MPTVKFIGRVLPVNVITVSVVTPPLTWNSPDTGLDCTITVAIQDSIVTVTCDTNRVAPDDLAHLYFRAFDLARAPVDLISFSKAGRAAATALGFSRMNPS
jgi:hypothetical protein